MEQFGPYPGKRGPEEYYQGFRAKGICSVESEIRKILWNGKYEEGLSKVWI
jgi:hypothetical protein